MLRTVSFVSLAVLICCLAACGHSDEKTDISHTYQMRDESGRNAGSVTFGPVGSSGTVRDADGRMVGHVVAPPADEAH